MKRTILAALAAFAFTLSFAADNPTSKKDFEVREFTGLKVGHASSVTVVKADKCGLTVEVDSECMEFVELSYLEDGTLRVTYDKLPFKFQNSKRSHMKITAYMPHLNYIDISGTSQLTATGEFTTSAAMGTFNLSCTGASTVDSLKISAPRANLHVTGASKAVIIGAFGELISDISGASKGIISGSADEFNLEVSGASNLNSEDLEAKDAKVDVSGASKANVYVQKSLDVKVSGASACTYMAPNPVTLEVRGVSGASSFKKKEIKEKK